MVLAMAYSISTVSTASLLASITGLIHLQDDLYMAMKSSVDGFRQLVGAPDTPKWNSVLFGGEQPMVEVVA